MVKESEIGKIIAEAHSEILDLWQKQLVLNVKSLVEAIGVKEMKQYTSQFMTSFAKASVVTHEIQSKEFAPVLSLLAKLSELMTQLNVSPTDTSLFTFSLKDAIFPILQKHCANRELGVLVYDVNTVIDRLGLYSFNAYLESRERIINEQQKALLETSVPVVKIWDGILMIPLVGMLDSTRTQLMMETMLTAMEESQYQIAILDISGIPIVDSLVARHLITAANAVRLMGGECIVTGIRARISQTLVQLGIDLSNIITRTTLADGLQYAITKISNKI